MAFMTSTYEYKQFYLGSSPVNDQSRTTTPPAMAGNHSRATSKRCQRPNSPTVSNTCSNVASLNGSSMEEFEEDNCCETKDGDLDSSGRTSLSNMLALTVGRYDNTTAMQ